MQTVLESVNVSWLCHRAQRPVKLELSRKDTIILPEPARPRLVYGSGRLGTEQSVP